MIKKKGWKHLRKNYPALIMPYRRKRYWYSAWNLARRFILIGIASVPTTRPDFSATALAVTVGAVLGFHVFSRPFYHEINNKLETFALFCAFGVSILNIMLNKPPFYATITAFLAFAPLIPVPFLLYQYLSDKSPLTLAVTKENLLDSKQDSNDVIMSRAQSIRLRNTDSTQAKMERAKTTRIQQQNIKHQQASWKSIQLGRGKKLHLIKKRDLKEETKQIHTNHSILNEGEEEEFYPSSDSRSWSGLSHLSYTKDEDFIDEELDKRTLWQVLSGKKVEEYDSSSSHSQHSDIEQNDNSDDSSLADNEIAVDLKENDEESQSIKDHVNDYWVNQKKLKKQNKSTLSIFKRTKSRKNNNFVPFTPTDKEKNINNKYTKYKDANSAYFEAYDPFQTHLELQQTKKEYKL